MEILTQEQIKKLNFEETREIHNQFIIKYDMFERNSEQNKFVRNLQTHFQELGGKIKKTPYEKHNNKSEPVSKKSHYDDFDFKPKENKHKQKPMGDQFLALPYKKFFNNEELMKKIANKTGLLLVLLRNIVDWNKNERLNLYQEYFVKRNLLVASISRHRLAEMFGGSDVRRITAWVKALERDGIIKIEQIPCMDDDDHRKKYNVYILGEVNDDESYTFFYEK
ncbi:MAG TPA: hypothetical protein VMW95_02195 [Desulfobacterales bacterium]|nr:hypothetical protein [Desulfobacterales bacterium]